MQHFFWDTGVAIGYIFSFDELPYGIEATEIDHWAEHASSFVSRFSDQTHVLSGLTANREIPNVSKNICNRLEKCQLLLLEYSPDDVLKECTPEDKKYIYNIIQRKSKWNADDLLNFLTDVKIMIHENKKNLLKSRISQVYDEHHQDIKLELGNFIQNINDSHNFACATHYMDIYSHPTKFITTDYKDLRNPKVNKFLKEKFLNRKFPEIQGLGEVSGHQPKIK